MTQYRHRNGHTDDRYTAKPEPSMRITNVNTGESRLVSLTAFGTNYEEIQPRYTAEKRSVLDGTQEMCYTRTEKQAQRIADLLNAAEEQ